LNVSPKAIAVHRSDSLSFTASEAATWSIQEGASGGTISEAGLYIAPDVDGTYHVIATAKSDPAKNAVATVTITGSSFYLTGSLINPRVYHTATLLPNGQVLIAGGLNGSNFVEAEEFDPATGTFHAAGTVTRALHTASTLPNGDVLLAGGVTTIGDKTWIPSASAEIFKTGSGVPQPTGSMTTPRIFHTATALQDGRVLIAGGLIPNDRATETAEVYDLESGTFSPAGNMSVARFGHTATLLQDGRVLIAGWGSADLYDPATNSFTAISNAPASRFLPTATLLPDGKVLIAGGESYYDEAFMGPAELYDPATGKFTATGSMILPRFSHTATLLSDGTVLIAGGLDADENGTATAEIYEPSTGVFKPAPSMKTALAGHTATLLPDGSVLIAGDATQAEIYK
jgi:hypothetical protein